ncbi:integrator complex assembly factor BRAT1 [Polymixia lowei]
MTMDRECVALLPHVCKVLADSGRSLPDDTSLEKLLDWFTGLTSTGRSLLDACPCLSEFISSVIHNTASDPSVLSFTLKLTGLLAATEDSFRLLQEHSILGLAFDSQRWQEAGLWEDPCMRIGWIQGLRNMLQHPLALHFLITTELTKPLLQLQTDASLFVASAANQVLAHILVCFQPVSSEGCHGMKKEENEGRTHACTKAPVAMETDIESLAFSMGTSCEYTAVTMDILEHLKVSLVSKENVHLHQSLQSLKLVALLLAQARTPLRGMLLSTVLGSLEALVTAGHSQQTPLLLDILLTAYSCSDPDERARDRTVSRLVSRMLDTYKPPDLIHAAAAVLRRDHCDLVLTTKAVGILLLPFDIITGLALMSTHSPAAEDQRSSVTEVLNSKASCISVLCLCLTHTPPIAVMPPDFLPCPPVLVVTAVVCLLRLCGGHAPSSSTGSSKACRNVIGCGKMQKCGLEALAALSASPGAKEKISEVFTVLIQYLHNPDSDPTVLHKSYQALVKWMSICTDLSSVGDELRQDLLTVVRKRVCDVRWEVRDSTVEFLGQLAGVCICPESAQETCMSEALLECSTTPLLVEALCDPESYVRASAATALAQTLAHSWQQGAAPTEEQADIVSRLLDILSKDTEGFARRAVVQYFIAWFSTWSSKASPSSPSSFSLLMKSVRSVLSRGCTDLDWEVKVHTLELAQLLLDKALPGHQGSRLGSETHTAPPTSGLTQIPHPYAVGSDQAYTLHTHAGIRSLEQTHRDQANGGGCMEGIDSDLASLLRGLVEQGVVSALLSSLFDCDRPVALKACHLLITLREAICPLSLGALDTSAAQTTVAKVSCELQGWGSGREIRTLLEKKRDRTREAGASEPNRSMGIQGFDRTDKADPEECDRVREEGASEEDDSVCVSVCEVLRSLGLDERLAVLTQSSDHVQNSPLSLLQDILTARGTHTHSDTHPGQEVIVDCY